MAIVAAFRTLSAEDLRSITALTTVIKNAERKQYYLGGVCSKGSLV